MKKLYPIFGIIGPMLYAVAVIFGAVLRDDYSSLADTISALTSDNAPNLLLMDVLFGLYNISIIVFGVGAFRDSSVNLTKKYTAATFMIVLIGVLGLLMLVFTQPVPITNVTTEGTIHLILAGVSSLITMIAILLIGLVYWGNKQMRSFAIYSFISDIIILISGGMAAVSIGGNNGYGGLFERITIGFFLLWVIVFSYVILKKK